MESCQSPNALGTVADGLHSFEVRAVDRFGNTDQSPAAHAFLVDTQGPAMAIDGGTVKVRKGVAKVDVTCPGAELSGPCTGELKLKTAEKVKVGKDKRKVTLGSADFSAPAGGTDAATIKLSKSNRELVEDLGKVRVTATADAEDALGNEQRAKGELTLKAV